MFRFVLRLQPLIVPVIAFAGLVLASDGAPGLTPGAGAASELSIPDPLKPWVAWVLEQGPGGQDRRGCPLLSNDGARVCAWPGRLDLELTAGEGRFAQRWQVFADSWVALPGDETAWPQRVRDGERLLPAVLRDGHPAVKLQPGEHRLTGEYRWRARPQALAVPPQTGLVSLLMDGRPIERPNLEKGGRLWLQDATAARQEGKGDRLGLRVYRRIEDSLPLQVISRFELEISGRARDVRLGPVTLTGGIPLAIQSPLPARLDADGMLRLQVRPGRWVVEVSAYHSGAVSKLMRPRLSSPWPEDEIWAFAARPDLRQVALSGLPSLAPSQTGIPREWEQLPIYRAGKQAILSMHEQRRGDPDPGRDRLVLSRDIWLDFDGRGYSAKDSMTGELTRSWRLEAGPGFDLGRVEVNGAPSLITRLGAGGAPGVEVRRGALDLRADARMSTPDNALAASGWAISLDGVRSRLHLPPGWDLLAASGVDNDPGSWLNRWTLLDLFLILILTIGTGRIWGWRWGLVALLALALTWQSADAPRMVWLHLLAAAALLRRLPASPERTGLSRLRWLVLWYFRLTLVSLLAILLPFLVHEVRNGLYPQLNPVSMAAWEIPQENQGGSAAEAPLNAAAAPTFQFESLDDAGALPEQGLRKALPAPASLPAATPPPDSLERLDPNARVQTGPGIPSWHGRSFDLSWTGPVGPDERARLWLLTPGWSLAATLLGCSLLVLFGLRLAGVWPRADRAARGLTILVVIVMGVGLTAGPGPATAGDLPSAELLEELRERLTQPPDCLPSCLDIPALELRVEPEQLTLELTLDAVVAMGAPIPGGAGGWLPTRIVLDGREVDLLSRGGQDQLMLPLPAGRHRLVLSGSLSGSNQVDLALPLPPRQVQAQTLGWRLEGVDANGRAGPQLQLIRIAGRDAAAEQPLTQDSLPPLLLVERRLMLGTDWRIETRVTRLSAPDFPLQLPVGLIPGEAVQSADVQVQDGRARVSLAPGITGMGWRSSLEPVAELSLSAATDSRIAEVWHLDLGPLWHLAYEGFPPVHHRRSGDRWMPSWRPLPGERLTLRISRPPAIAGPTLTIDRVDYVAQPGPRGTDADLSVIARSSQGGRHRLQLPDGAELRRISVDGRSLPLPAGGTEVEFPLVPGSQQLQVSWRDSVALGTSFKPVLPDLRTTAVNISQSLRLSSDRWVLLAAGPQVGPAVLFWGMLLVVAGLAVPLGRSRLTPLRGYDWFLLGGGLMLSNVWVVLLLAGWLFALARRSRIAEDIRPWRFNLIQVGLILLTLAALAALILAVQQGLLGRPEMQIQGNGSSAASLNWYQDRGGPRLPEIWVLSVPMWFYRALMLGWALWLAFRLLAWLRWGWDGFSNPQLWRERQGERKAGRRTGTKEPPATGGRPSGSAAHDSSQGAGVERPTE